VAVHERTSSTLRRARSITARHPAPDRYASAVLVITAHWEPQFLVSQPAASMICYSGPPHTYQFSTRRPAPPSWRHQVKRLLTGAGHPARLDQRGFQPRHLQRPVPHLPAGGHCRWCGCRCNTTTTIRWRRGGPRAGQLAPPGRADHWQRPVLPPTCANSARVPSPPPAVRFLATPGISPAPRAGTAGLESAPGGRQAHPQETITLMVALQCGRAGGGAGGVPRGGFFLWNWHSNQFQVWKAPPLKKNATRQPCRGVFR
jgi:hypothetical protein